MDLYECLRYIPFGQVVRIQNIDSGEILQENLAQDIREDEKPKFDLCAEVISFTAAGDILIVEIKEE